MHLFVYPADVMLRYLWLKESKYSIGPAPFYSSSVSPDNKFRNSSFVLVIHQLVGRLSNVLKSFKEHFLECNTEGLVPKLSSNVQLYSECVDLVRKEFLEKENFLQFHEKLAAGNEVGNSECRCLRVPSARANLSKFNVTN